MALKKCSECGEKVSSKARACPGCGAPVKGGSWFVTILLAVIITALLVSIFGGGDPPDQVSERPADVVAPVSSIKKTKTAEEIRKEQLADQFSFWDGSHRGVERYIKNLINDPKSYEHAETTYRDMGDHLIIHTKFRGKNLFGGTVSHWIYAKVDLDGNVIDVLDESPWR